MRLVPVLLVLSSVLGFAVASKEQAAPSPSRPTRYYLVARVRLHDAKSAGVFGASNLPTGALLTINISDFLGEGSSVLAEANATVGVDGLFYVEIYPKSGAILRYNQVCEIIFFPNYPPQQPPAVVNVVGQNGERLGDLTNPNVLVGGSDLKFLGVTTVVGS